MMMSKTKEPPLEGAKRPPLKAAPMLETRMRFRIGQRKPDLDIGSITRRLRGSSAFEKWDALEDLCTLAADDLETAKGALPAVLANLEDRSILTKGVASEAIAVLVGINGSPKGILDRRSLQTLIRITNDVKERARNASVIDWNAEHERYLRILRDTIVPGPAATPLEE